MAMESVLLMLRVGIDNCVFWLCLLSFKEDDDWGGIKFNIQHRQHNFIIITWMLPWSYKIISVSLKNF